jgi:uncharacterized membrane protein
VRWKLLIITSLVAALLSAGGMYLLICLLVAYPTLLRGPNSLIAGLLLIPLFITTLAFIFVYRHTARRRKLQATLTALASLVLTAVVFSLIINILNVVFPQFPR